MKRLEFLDSLRGLAAVYVVVFHAVRLPPFKMDPPLWAKTIVLFGGTGVTLFFVVSAFSLCLTMPRHLDKPMPLFSFYASRFFRIAPLFYVMIPISIARNIFVYDAWQPLDSVLLSMMFLYNFVPGEQTGFVWASWTIGVEAVFYAVFPLACFTLRTLPLKLAALFTALVAALALPMMLAYLLPPGSDLAEYGKFCVIRHLPVFLIGMVAFDCHQKLHQRGATPDIGLAIFAFGVLGMASMLALPKAGFLMPPYYWVAIYYAAILIGLSLMPLEFIVNSITKFLGQISYSVYLLHPTIIYFLSPVYKIIYDQSEIPLSVRFVLCIALTLVTVVSAAWVAYHWIEKPGIRLGHRVIDSVSARRMQPAE